MGFRLCIYAHCRNRVIKSLLPDTLKIRSLLLLAVIFVLSHILSLHIYASNLDDSILLTEARDLAERIGGIVDLAFTFPAEQRTSILGAAQTQFITLFPDIVPLDDIACQKNTFAHAVQERIITAFAHHPDYIIDVCLRDFDNLSSMLALNPNNALDMLVNIQFPDGETASFRALLPRAESLFVEATLIYLTLVTLATLILAWALISKLIEPISHLSNAALDIGTNLDSSPLPEKGPKEIRLSAQAFNKMQARLQRVVKGQTEMFAAVSHDLKSALTRLQLRAEMLNDDTEREGMERVVNDMRQMVTSIIDFIRGGNSVEAKRQVNLSYLIQVVANDFRDEGKDISDHVSDNVSLLCQASEIRRVIQNLLNNAVTYAGHANIELVQTSNTVVMSITDNGPGIPEQLLSEVIRPFVRVEPSRSNATGGQGLGLAIVNNIVQAHGGEMHLSNRAEGGLKVVIELPTARAKNAPTGSHIT